MFDQNESISKEKLGEIVESLWPKAYLFGVKIYLGSYFFILHDRETDEPYDGGIVLNPRTHEVDIWNTATIGVNNMDKFIDAAFVDFENEPVEHHGIKGQKWGVRRFQNPDGSYTPQGLERRKQNNPTGVNGTHVTLDSLAKTKVVNSVIDGIKNAPISVAVSFAIGQVLGDSVSPVLKAYAHAGVLFGTQYILSEIKSRRINPEKSNAKLDEKEGVEGRATTEKTHKENMGDSVDSANNAIKNINRYRGDINCETTAMAYDLNRRGYSVSAPNQAPIGTMSEAISAIYKADKATVAKNASSIGTFKHRNPLSSDPYPKAGRDGAQKALDIIQSSDSNKGFLVLAWGNSGSHAVAYERIEGKVRIIDPQNSTKVFTDSEAISMLKNSTDIGMYRSDNLVPRDSAIPNYYRKGTSELYHYALDQEYLEHYGIKGQKWGVRRFETYAGHLTPRGLSRYADKTVRTIRKAGKATKLLNAETYKDKIHVTTVAKHVSNKKQHKKEAKAEKLNADQNESKKEELTQEDKKRKVINTAVGVATVAAGTYGAYRALKNGNIDRAVYRLSKSGIKAIDMGKEVLESKGVKLYDDPDEYL